MTSLLLVSLLAASPALQVGSTAPDFTVKTSEGKTVTLSKLAQSGPVVLAFFPKAFTGGCTHELKAYRDRFGELTASGAKVFAISSDDEETMQRFRADLKAPFEFLPDPDGKLIALYDVKMPALNLAKRRTFVLDSALKILRIDDGSAALDPSTAIAACPLKKSAK
jgi:thioredoxin-dependent peroxiredoxin